MAKQDVTVELFHSGQWNDVTADVYTRDQIKLKRGRQDEASEVSPSSCKLTLEGAKYNPRNVGGSLHGLIGRNTPIRVHLGMPHVGDSQSDLVDTTSHVAPSVQSPTDDALLLCAWAAPQNDTWTLPGSMTAVTNQISTQSIQAASEAITASGPTGTRTATFDVSEDYMSASVLLHGTSPTIQASEGDSDQTMSLGASTQAGWWVVMFTSFWTSGELEIHDAPLNPIASNVSWFKVADTKSLHVNETHAEYMQMKVWIGRIEVSGSQSITFDWSGGTARSCMIVVSGVGDHGDARFAGEVSSWAPRRSVDEHDVYVEVQAAGIMRRLGQGSSPLRSALTRSMLSAPVVAYWPMEAGSAATQFASPLNGVSPMSFSGDVALGSFDPLPGIRGSAPLPVFRAGSSWRASIPPFTPDPNNGWLIDCLFYFEGPGPVAADETIFDISVTGSPAVRWRLVLKSDNDIYVQSFDEDGVMQSEHDVNLDASKFFGNPLRISFEVADFLTSSLFWDLGIRVNLTDEVINTITGATVGWPNPAVMGRPVSVGAGPLGSTSPVNRTWGHVLAAPAPDSIRLNLIDFNADDGYVGERAGYRIARLCREEEIPLLFLGNAGDTVALGPQRPETLLTLLREAATTDGGILGEDLTRLGLLYRTRRSLYNQSAVLSLDYSAGEVGPPLEPAEDDQGLRNDVTVSRRDGGEFRAQQTTGPLSVADPPAGVGRYDTDVDVNVVGDGFLADQAHWRLHLGTVEEQRWPQITVDLDAAPSLASAVAGLQLGDRLDIVNPPSDLTPNTIAALVQGWSETIGSHRRKIRFNASPEIPWRVAEYDDTQGEVNKYDTAGSSLASQFVAGTDTSMSVSVDIPPLWTTDVAEFPFDINVGGVRLTVTAISGASSPQTFTITQTPVNGVAKTLAAGTGVRLWRTPVYAL